MAFLRRAKAKDPSGIPIFEEQFGDTVLAYQNVRDPALKPLITNLRSKPMMTVMNAFRGMAFFSVSDENNVVRATAGTEILGIIPRENVGFNWMEKMVPEHERDRLTRVITETKSLGEKKASKMAPDMNVTPRLTYDPSTGKPTGHVKPMLAFRVPVYGETGDYHGKLAILFDWSNPESHRVSAEKMRDLMMVTGLTQPFGSNISRALSGAISARDRVSEVRGNLMPVVLAAAEAGRPPSLEVLGLIGEHLSGMDRELAGSSTALSENLDSHELNFFARGELGPVSNALSLREGVDAVLAARDSSTSFFGGVLVKQGVFANPFFTEADAEKLRDVNVTVDVDPETLVASTPDRLQYTVAAFLAKAYENILLKGGRPDAGDISISNKGGELVMTDNGVAYPDALCANPIQALRGSCLRGGESGRFGPELFGALACFEADRGRSLNIRKNLDGQQTFLENEVRIRLQLRQPEDVIC